MKYCVMAYLTFPDIDTAKHVKNFVKNNMTGMTWGVESFNTGIENGPGEGNKPYAAVSLRFFEKSDMINLFNKIKNRLDEIKDMGIHGRVTYHNCKHDENVMNPCVINKEYVI